MDTNEIVPSNGMPRMVPTPRRFAQVCFRHRRLVLFTFCTIFAASLAYVFLRPRQYEAETEILVRRERADPVVTPDHNALPLLTTDVSEEELNSEVEILSSRDLLEKVVIACRLDREPPHSIVTGAIDRLTALLPHQNEAGLAVPRAVRALQKHLKVEAIRKSNLIKVTYESPDPVLAANVLRTLTNSYLQKHLEVHRPPGTFAFFEQQATMYAKALQVAEKRLAAFDQTEDTVSAQAEKSDEQGKLVEFEATLRQTRVAIAATERRAQKLSAQMATTAHRMTTEVKTNSLLLEQLKSTLLNLELKRTDMSGKYATGYVPLRDLESEIAETKAAIAHEENRPLHDDTTDRNPTYQWLNDELAKARTDVSSLESQAAETEQQIRTYRSELLVLDQKDLAQQDLARAVKVQEANFLLYQNKREEARISDALDQKHIANVSVAEAATTPALPSDLSPPMALFFGLVLACSASLSAAFGADRFNVVLKNPDDVRMLLELPVLASFPKQLAGSTRRS